MESVFQEQHYLSKYSNISLIISDQLPDFERQSHAALVYKDLKNQLKI